MKDKKHTKIAVILSVSVFFLFAFFVSAFFSAKTNQLDVCSVSVATQKADSGAVAISDVETDTESADYTAPQIIQGYDTHFLDEKYGTHCLLYVCEQENNLITDSSFENGNGNWNQSTLLDSGVMSVVSSNTAKDGNKCLSFKANNLASDAWCMFYLDVEPNSVYYFTAFAKGELWSDTNKCDLSFGLIDFSTGKFVADSYSNRHCEDYQLGITFDNSWHAVRVEVNTGSATKIGIGFTGKSSIAYIDDIYFFKQEDAVEYQFPKRDVEFPTVTDENPEYIGCNTDYNLVEDYNFEDESNSFWKDSLGYGITADIVNTDSDTGKVLHYVENAYGTGVPKRTYYIKWIDVEPDTEYTFSAKCQVLKSGEGWFGVINGSEYLPAAIKKFKLNELTQLDSHLWNSVGVTFNSGGFSRVGIAVCDVGGEFYLDDVRLFEKNYGITLETDPNVQSFRFEYEYNDVLVDPESETNKDSVFTMGNAYLHYKSDLNKVTIENEDSNNYMRIERIKSNPTIPLRTTIQLEPNSYYKVSFRYKLKTTNMSSTGNWVSKPVFTACLGKNVWYNYLVKLDETRPCQLSGNTFSEDGYSYTESRGLVGMHLESSEEWLTYSEIIYTGSVVGGADVDQKYLGLYFIMGDTIETICLDDFVAEKTDKEEISPEKTMLNFDGTDGADTYRNLLSMNKIDTENGYLHITDNGRYYNFNGMNFGVMLKPDSDYEIEMRYKLNKCTSKASQIFGLYEKENFFGSSHTVFSSDEPIYNFDRTVMTDFNTVKFNFTTSADDGVKKWLTFAAETNVGIDMYIDWIKITRIPKYDELTDIVDFENGQDADYTDGTMTYSYEKDGNGNRYMKISAKNSDDEYPHFTFRTDAQLKPQTDYTVSFQYKSTESWYDRAFLLAGNGIDNWQFRYKPYWTSDSTVANRTNLIGDEFTDSAGYTYRTGKLALKSADEWTKFETTFNTGDIADGLFKYLSFLIQFAPTGHEVREFCIDDLVVIEHNVDAPDGYVLAFKGYGNSPRFIKASQVTDLAEADGYLFNGWYTDKSFTEQFDSSVTVSLPYTVYADYEHDFNGDKLCNLLDLVRLKRVVAGAEENYVSASDVNGDTLINALDLAVIKDYMLTSLS